MPDIIIGGIPITNTNTVFSLYKNQDQFMGSMNMVVVVFSIHNIQN